jgi:hypothetical protein
MKTMILLAVLGLNGCALCQQSRVACGVVSALGVGAIVMLAHKQGGDEFCKRNPTVDQCR